MKLLALAPTALAALALLAAAPRPTHAARSEADLSASLADAFRSAASASASVDAGLAAAVAADAEARGEENCENKCQALFGRLAYSIQAQQGLDTYEYSACRAGCRICSAVIAANPSDRSACFTTCKNTNWLDNVDLEGKPFPIVKGLIEPDKACIIGCITSACAGVCQGSTSDPTETPQNTDKWWGNGGCSIKTGAVRPGGFYSQAGQYNFYNMPSGAAGQAECCAGAMSLCQYKGDKKSTNFAQVLAQAQNHCVNVPGAGQTEGSICKFFKNKNNCGSAL